MAINRTQLNKDEREIEIKFESLRMKGLLALPAHAKGLVLFAHGSGSSRWSPRNNFVARELQKTGMATLLMDLLTEEEESDRGNVFDIELLAQRLNLAKAWLSEQPTTQSLAIGFFGASTGAGAALVAAAQNPENIFAVVSRGGRPDLAEKYLHEVQAPTLLIVGGLDTMVIGLNQQAFRRLKCEKKMEIVPGATHLFEEVGTLEHVARLATQWFATHSITPKTKASPRSQEKLRPPPP